MIAECSGFGWVFVEAFDPKFFRFYSDGLFINIEIFFNDIYRTVSKVPRHSYIPFIIDLGGKEYVIP